ncbi:uncharacterized protein BJX67DRAFT_384392 [Aspergillus lucknowensis]|uniref:Uncharacterized protein n=1 Tax=Aspergillus lucknowensis TaxID=176173 RepID=A0ABR4LGM6_9EURO
MCQKRNRDGRAVVRLDSKTVKPVVDVLKACTVQKGPMTPVKLAAIEEYLDQLLGLCWPPKSVPATNHDSVAEAVGDVRVIYEWFNQGHIWKLRESDYFSDGKLSGWAETCISKLLSSPYFQRANSESTARIVFDVLFCDRLESLDAHEAGKKLNWYPKVILSVTSKTNDFSIHGRADRCLSYGTKAARETALVVLFVSSFSIQTKTIKLTLVGEAKKPGAMGPALAQLIIYLAAVQDARKQVNINPSVFGVISDSRVYQFAWLDGNRKLFVSDVYSWVSNQSIIIKWIDRMLRDSIKASPYTPVKTGDTAIHAYQTHPNSTV